jgi:RimJ/RimL family protein N-acetyltransferase
MKTNYKTLETDRLLIRPMQISDAVFFLELVNSPKWKKYIGDRKVKTLKDSEEYIKVKMLPQLEKLGYGNNIVIRKEDGIPVSSCGLYDREGLEGIDIGYAVLPQFEGKGYAFESVNRLKEAAIKDFGISKINAITLPENKASKNLLIKLGFTFQKMVKIPNDPVELMFFSLYAKENK